MPSVFAIYSILRLLNIPMYYFAKAEELKRRFSFGYKLRIFLYVIYLCWFWFSPVCLIEQETDVIAAFTHIGVVDQELYPEIKEVLLGSSFRRSICSKNTKGKNASQIIYIVLEKKQTKMQSILGISGEIFHVEISLGEIYAKKESDLQFYYMIKADCIRSYLEIMNIVK